MVRNIVFDFCGVLLDWRPRLALQGQYPLGVIDMFFDPADPWGFEHYDALSDAGWSEQAVLDDYEGHHGPAVAWVFRVYFQRYEQTIRGMMPGMGRLLADLDAAGIGLWGLTNFTEKYVAAARRKVPELSLLRSVAVSARDHLCKPDERFYRLAIGRFGIEPSTSVFIDDRRTNVTVAERIGMSGIRFADAQQVRARLRGLGVAL